MEPNIEFFGDGTRAYTPSKLSELPPLNTTSPTDGPLNNLGSYNAADPGPIIASDDERPRLREDGQAFWDDNAPSLLFSSSPSPVAGRSPQDSRMNSPESEEPTIPAFDTTQVGPATLQAIDLALAEDSQTLWANVPSLPTALPPTPEGFEAGDRTFNTSRTPRGRSRALPDASAWNHATAESAPVVGSPTRLLPPTGPSAHPTAPSLTGARFTSTLAAIKAGILSDPYDPSAINPVHLIGFTPAVAAVLADNESTLKEEIARDVTEIAMGWGALIH
ncbi:hypothetical protein EDB84DRAFT_1572668 [Lactarius hengduanensis]|nr:hypothetical protein EDB84DRAFT_1572668 [Lactarius hengduanensis]